MRTQLLTRHEAEPTNLFDHLAETGEDEAAPRWAARAPRRPRSSYDVKLLPRALDWQDDAASREALGEIAEQPWVERVIQLGEEVRLRVRDEWVESHGAALEAGGSDETSLSDLATGRSFSVQFWDANATKALHAGHLRNLAIGNAIAAALTQAGAIVERRSLISDAGRSMGEAMAGVLSSGRAPGGWPAGEKSDHFVGECYAAYVASASLLKAGADGGQAVEDSLARELDLRDDDADRLMRRVLDGDAEALELWQRTRSWVIAGQRRTLARLGVAFDRVFFESDFLPDAAELTQRGLRDGRMRRREDGTVVYATGLHDLDELPLVRADGLPTQHMRALAYWMAAPELGASTSMQVCGTEWVSHVTCRRQLMDELRGGAQAPMHPSHDIFNGMVAAQKRPLASSEGALLIDELLDWIEGAVENDRDASAVRRMHPFPERVPAQIALAFFLPHAVAPRLEFEPPRLLRPGTSLGWDLIRARARAGRAPTQRGARPALDPDYRFAVVQSELYRRYLRLAVERLDVRPLAHYLKHLAAWYLEREHGEHVERVVHTLLDRAARGLGIEAAS